MYSAAGLQVCPRPNSGAQRSTGDLSPESRALSFGACPLRSPLPPPVTAVSPQTASTPTHRLRPLSLCPRVVPPSLLPPLWPSLPKVRRVHGRISRESWEAALGRSLWLRTSSYLKIAGEKEGATHAATMPTPSCTLFSDRVAPGHPVLNPYAATPGPYSQTEL